MASGNIWISCLKYEWYLESCIPKMFRKNSYLKHDFQILLEVDVDKVQPNSFLIQFNVPFKNISLIETRQSIGGAKRKYPG